MRRIVMGGRPHHDERDDKTNIIRNKGSPDTNGIFHRRMPPMKAKVPTVSKPSIIQPPMSILLLAFSKREGD
jgi:hypothetical protein